MKAPPHKLFDTGAAKSIPKSIFLDGGGTKRTNTYLLYFLKKMALIQMLGISLIEAAACWIRLTSKSQLIWIFIGKKVRIWPTYPCQVTGVKRSNLL